MSELSVCGARVNSRSDKTVGAGKSIGPQINSRLNEETSEHLVWRSRLRAARCAVDG